MKRIARGGLWLVLLAVVFGALTEGLRAEEVKALPEPRGPWFGKSARLPQGVKHADYFSERMQTSVGYCVYLPPGYDEGTERYPVVYFLHGAGSSEYTQNLIYVPHVDAAIRAGSLRPMILVFPNGGSFSFYSDSADGKLLAETTLIRELIPHVDRSYRTIAGRQGRGVQGMSMGGFGALKFGMKYPEIFGSVVSIAGGFLAAEEMEKFAEAFGPVFGGKVENYSRNEPLRLARENRARVTELRLPVAMFIGQSDTNISGLNLLRQNRTMHEELTKLGIPHRYEELPEADHDVALLAAQLKARTFRFAAEHFGAE